MTTAQHDRTRVAAATDTSRHGIRRHLSSGWLALLIGACGFGYRLALLLTDSPPTNSDEATMGLAAAQIADGREFPIFFYGQHYMGALEAYLAVPLFLVAGSSVLALRLPVLLLYAVFVAAMYFLTRRLYHPRLAVLTVAVLALGSDRVIKNQLIAAGGYPELSPAVALLFLLVLALGTGAVRRRTLAYAASGLLVGLMLWVDWLALPYLAAAGAALGWTVRRELLGRRGLALLGGFALGAAPIIAYNLGAAPGADSLSVFLSQNAGLDGLPIRSRLHGGVLFGVPIGTGMCAPGQCAGWSMWWGAVYPALLLAAGVLAVRGLRRSVDDRVRHGYRLALVAAAGLTLLAYSRSAASAADPVENSRYLSALLISTPAVLWPLAAALGRAVAPTANRLQRLGGGSAAAALVAMLVTALVATTGPVAQAPSMHRRADNLQTLVDTLRQRGITRVYSNYWTCNLITFLSRERTICAVIDENLRPGQDRYAPYRAVVAASPNPAYVVPVNLPMEATVAAAIHRSDPGAEVFTVAGYHIYQPRQPVGPGS